ncbi:MAG: isoprenylcysteine carboxylmethyltransferase family protein [Chitinophagales bacterium]|nr:isoprenylcysteine carboxylmethyltransferase family protein [Bacteroidota bacterium]
MQAYIGFFVFILLFLCVRYKAKRLENEGIKAVEFGQKDKTDLILLPFAVFYVFMLSANAFHYCKTPGRLLFESQIINWIGVLVCFISILFFLWALVSFKKSFRVGLVENIEQGLITSGAFSISRNPIYVAFALMLIGQFLIFPNWILLIYIIAGCCTFHYRILLEEKFLIQQYGKSATDYFSKVRRYL